MLFLITWLSRLAFTRVTYVRGGQRGAGGVRLVAPGGCPGDVRRASVEAGQRGWHSRSLPPTGQETKGTELGRRERDSPGPRQADRGGIGATHPGQPKGRGRSTSTGSEENRGEATCPGFSTFSESPEHRQLEKPILKNHLLSIMESDSPFYYHPFLSLNDSLLLDF